MFLQLEAISFHAGLLWNLGTGLSRTLAYSSAAALAIAVLMVGFFFSFFLFLGLFFLDHHVAMQDIDRCVVVKAREKLPIGRD